MQNSTDRILTTHAGSLIRPPEIIEVMKARDADQSYDEAAFAAHVRRSVAEVVRKQAEVGVDIPSDGEQSKPSFFAYTHDRLTGFERRPPLRGEAPGPVGKDRQDFAAFYAQYDPLARRMWLPPSVSPSSAPLALGRTVCTGPITYKGQAAVQRDIENFKAALAGVTVAEAFLPAAAPTMVQYGSRNEHYPSDEAYVYTLADALKEEYHAIVKAGFLLQIDAPELPATYDRMLAHGLTLKEYRTYATLCVEAINHALAGIPEDRVRYHICWGSWNGPHTTDVPLQDILDILLQVRAQAYSIEAANPRHEHEWQVWKDVKLADGKMLIPGVITHSTNIVEHPELVALRLKNYTQYVGRENVIAGTDCGFSQSWSAIRVHPRRFNGPNSRRSPQGLGWQRESCGGNSRL